MKFPNDHLYILKDKKPVSTSNVLEWARWIETAETQVGFTMVGDVKVSTLFLGVNLSLFGGIPILFETMIFGGELDRSQERYSTYEDAERGHKKWVYKVKTSINKKHGKPKKK